MTDPHDALTARAEALRRRCDALTAHLRNADRELPTDAPDRAQMEQADEVYEALEASSRTELDATRRAIARIDAGLPAICEGCGGVIDERRLIAIPTAITCIRCAN